MRNRLVFLCVGVACTYVGLLAGTHAAHPHRQIASEAAEESQIRKVLDAQAAAWNRGDIDSFMSYYWKSDETLFVAAGGVARGWQAVLDRYHKSYPNQQAMGHLTFSNVEVRTDCADAATVIGEFHLQRQSDQPAGVYTLNLRKFSDGWKIVVDHTSAFPAHGGAKQQ
jgi:uncharacterized protein (TIGR02246 family)